MKTHPDLSEITRRLESLERQNHRLKAVVTAAVLAIVCGSLMAATGMADRTIDVRRLSLRDANGRERCRLEVNDKGEVVQSFIDSNGTDRIAFRVDDEDNATIGLYHKPEDVRALMFLSKGGDVGQILRDRVRTRIDQVVRADGVALQRSIDGKGTVRLLTQIDPDGLAAQRFSDQAGKSRVLISTEENGNAGLIMADPTGKDRFNWLTMTDGTASHAASDKEGRLRFVTMTLPNGNAAQHAVDPAGVARIEAWTTSEGFAYHQVNDRKHVMRFVSGTGPNGEATQGAFDDQGKKRFTVATRPDGSAYQIMNGKREEDPYSLLFSSPETGVVHQFSIGDGILKVATMVKPDGTSSHYVEKSAWEQALDLARKAKEVVGVTRDAIGVYNYINNKSQSPQK